MLDLLIWSFNFTVHDKRIRERGDRPMVLLGYGLYNLEKIAPGICKERNAEAHCRDVMWFAGDRHAATLQLIDDSVDTIDAETRMVPARHVVAVMQVLIGRAICCAWPSHQFEMETLVSSRVQKNRS